MFLVQGFFELFETMLSYFSILSMCVSGIRGQSCRDHGSRACCRAQDGSPNWIGSHHRQYCQARTEGLIVGIRVLRLEYYDVQPVL